MPHTTHLGDIHFTTDEADNALATAQTSPDRPQHVLAASLLIDEVASDHLQFPLDNRVAQSLRRRLDRGNPRCPRHERI